MKKITHCRACGSNSLTPVFSVEAASVGARKRGLLAHSRTEAIEFVLCDSTRDALACGLVQSAAAHCRSEAFEPSGAYRSNRSLLRAAATEALELISGRDCAALDIGCDDGTLLSFYPRWVERFGVDPSEHIDNVGSWAWSARSAFPSAELDRAIGAKKFDIITAISVLEHIDEPRAFLARAKSILAADGVMCIETLYAPMAMTGVNLEALFEGACSVYSLGVLERLVRDCDLKIFKGALTEKAGGSIRLFVTHADVEDYDFDPWYERLARLWDEENALALRAVAPYQAFEARANANRKEFSAFMAEAAGRGESAHILGAGHAAATLVGWCGEAGSAIEAAVCIHAPEVGGRLCPGGPPIVSEAASRAANPDVLIAPASLKREMLERWRDDIHRGARMMFVSPAPHVVSRANFAIEFGKALGGGEGDGGVDTLRAILKAAGGPRLVSDSGGRRSA